MWPFAADGRGSSTPAYPQQPVPLESSTDVCRKPGCDHVEPWVDGQMPAFLWRSAACQRAWTVAAQPPLAMCTAYVDPPAEKTAPVPWSWLPDPVKPLVREAS